MLAKFKKKQNRSPTRTLAVALLGLLIAVVFFGLMVANLKMHQKKRQLQAHLENLDQKVKQMQAKNENLKDGISESDNPEYIEKVAREELGLKQPGETVVSFIEPEVAEPQPAAQTQSILQKMLGAISGLLR